MLDPLTLQAFVQRYKISAIAQLVNENPNMDMPPGSSHWRVTLRFGRRRLTVPFSQGSARTAEPTAKDVLHCLVGDARSVACVGFEEWAAEMGWSADSRKAKRTYRLIEQQTTKLERFLGETYDAAMQAED